MDQQENSTVRLVYLSRAVSASSHDWKLILDSARRNNAAHGITGALFCDGFNYLQVLEGEKAAVQSIYLKIQMDKRHLHVKKTLFETIKERLFPSWSMGFVAVNHIEKLLKEHNIKPAGDRQLVLQIVQFLDERQNRLEPIARRLTQEFPEPLKP